MTPNEPEDIQFNEQDGYMNPIDITRQLPALPTGKEATNPDSHKKGGKC